MVELFKQFSRKIQSANKKITRHLTSFHAFHSSLKMDRIDYTFKFSTELVVVTLSLLVIGVNAAGASTLSSFNSNMFGRLLTYHPKQNIGLYNKTTTVNTVIAQGNGFISSASAKIVLAAENFQGSAVGANAENSAISDSRIVKPNPADIEALIADQIKVYDTQPGDTLSSIAERFGISTNTIIWANNLPNSNIKPGWNLVILPTNGVLRKVTNNDTLGDIAKKFKADVGRIISYNGLEDESDIEPGQLLIIPDGSVAPSPVVAAKPSIKHVVGGKVVYEPVSSDITDFSSLPDHIFPWGQCTWYASKLRGGVPWGGNAKNWMTNAKAYGAKIGQTPVVGAIVQTTENRRYGHVAIVKQVNGNSFLITEMNYTGLGRISERWLELGNPVIRGFIY